jgi:hypothetical protein
MIFGPRYPERRTGIVNLKNNVAIKGVIWRRAGEWLVLRNAEYIEGRKGNLPMDGEILIRMAEVLFVQIVEPG